MSIPKDCKRLAEVDFPIAVVSKHAAREKSIRHGHPSTLHLWWARRPLASSRAVLLALLLPDPCDEHCPPDFKAKARKLLPQVGCGKGETDAKLREGLLKFIGDFADWNSSVNATYLEVARGLVKAAHPEETPLVVDPFAGGGSIPLEALRLGCDAFASDLNPLPSLLQKILLEDIPRYGHELGTAFQEAATSIRGLLKEKVGSLYASGHVDEETTAYLWARTITCESPRCGAEVPLLRSLWLSKSHAARHGLRVGVIRKDGGTPEISVSVYAVPAGESPGRGTVLGGKATCPACGNLVLRDRIEAQLRIKRGGTDFARLTAVIATRGNERFVRDPCQADRDVAEVARARAEALRAEILEDGTPVLPFENLNPIRPSPNARGLSAVTRYGMKTFADCHIHRQKVVLAELTRLTRLRGAHGTSLESAVSRCLLAVLGRCVDRWSSCCRLDSTRDTVTGSFSKQALQLVWDFCEANPFSAWSGGYDNAVQWISSVIDRVAQASMSVGQVHLCDARHLPLPDESVQCWFTDPPYYDSVPYADLADFFYVWLRRANPNDPTFADVYDKSNFLTPKLQECVWNQGYQVEGRPKDSKFFEECAGTAFGEGARILNESGIGSIVFAHKTTEGWEALLNGVIHAGLVITSSWPIQTEMASRTAARDAASLMGSIHLVCRKRNSAAPIGDWGEVLRELPKRVAEWMQRLQAEHVRGADLVFACIGPALEIFSRYAKVETADGREVALAEYLEKVWEVVGRSALEQILGGTTGGAGALEEDARLTALFLWTLQSSNGVSAEASDDSEESGDDEDEAPKKKAGGYSLTFDVARRFAQPLGIHMPEWEGRIIETEKGVVRLLPVAERAKQLFGEDGTRTAAAAFERNAAAAPQMVLFPEEEAVVPKVKGRGRKKADGESKAGTIAPVRREATTLDRVHAAMLLQRSGQSNALRALLQAEQDRGPDFLRLANALSALYPRESEEKRLLDAMLLAVPR